MTEPVGDPEHADHEHVDAIVLGAGVSGLVSASVLVGQGADRVLVVDTYDRVGGNHLDRSVGGFTFDVGSFIFQDDSPLLAHFPELLERYVPIRPAWGKLTPQRTVARYPFAVRDDVLAAGPVEVARLLGSVAFARLFRRKLRTAGDFARYWIGARLLRRSGLENYMERFCGLPADRIDLRFAEKRMLWISEHASLPGLAHRVLPRRPAAPPAPPNQQLVRARDGFAHQYAPAVERLERAGVTFRLGEELRGVTRDGGGFRLALGSGTVRAPRLVSTVPIDHALDLCGLPRERTLPTVTLVSLFFSFAGRRGFDQPVLYNFDHTGAWKRLTVHSDFYGPHDGREFFAVEVIGGQVGDRADRAERDFRAHVAANGLFDGDLRLEGSHVLEHAYPIYTEGSADDAERGVAALRAFGVESFGRQGAFVYQPTARQSTIEAEQALRT